MSFLCVLFELDFEREKHQQIVFSAFSTSYFYRWKDGSCLEVGPVKYEKTTGGAQRNFDFESSTLNMNAGTKSGLDTTTTNQDAEHIYTFFDDIRYIPEIHEIATASQTVVQNTINNMKKFLLKFRNYKHLWRTDKVKQRCRAMIFDRHEPFSVGRL